MGKKLLSFLMAVVVLTSCLAVTGYAAETEEDAPKPIYVGNAETDYGADLILAELELAGKTDRQKIQAVYDWIILHCERTGTATQQYYIPEEYTQEIEAYAEQINGKIKAGDAVLRQDIVGQIYIPASSTDSYSYGYDSNWYVNRYALELMENRIGSCLNFSALLALLLGHLGYDSRLISGNFLNSDGTAPVHTWNYVLVNGEYYWLDVRIDHANYTRTGEVTHQYFMETDTAVWAKKHRWDKAYSDWLYANANQMRGLPEKSIFTDVQDSSLYFYLPVVWGTENQIVYGTSSTEFSPYETCTRAQAITFLYRMAGEPSTAGIRNPFSDVRSDDYFCQAVLWGYQNEIVKGTKENLFEPYATISRRDFVTFLYRMAGQPKIQNVKNPFKDVDTTLYFGSAVLWAYRNGITLGTTETQFSPLDKITRAQAVTFLYRYHLMG